MSPNLTGRATVPPRAGCEALAPPGRVPAAVRELDITRRASCGGPRGQHEVLRVLSLLPTQLRLRQESDPMGPAALMCDITGYE